MSLPHVTLHLDRRTGAVRAAGWRRHRDDEWPEHMADTVGKLSRYLIQLGEVRRPDDRFCARR